MLFDLDDTLVETNRLFLKRFEKCKEIVLNSNQSLDPVIVSEKIAAINVKSFQLMSGNLTKRWPYVTERIAEEFNITDTSYRDGILKTLQSLHHKLPELKQHAIEVLSQIRSTGVTMGLVTHANEAWTNFKVDGHKLRPYFDHIFIINEDSFKTPQSWTDAMAYFKTEPIQAAIVGDSLRSDIIPGAKAGAGKLFWIHEDTAWGYYHQGAIPAGAIEVKGLAHLLEALKH